VKTWCITFAVVLLQITFC